MMALNRWVFLVSILSLPTSLAAQTLTTVRSGEHPTFSRLVFEQTEEQAWNIARITSDTIEINFRNPLPVLDISAVFEKIPRSRLLGVRQERDNIYLDLGCRCEVDIFQLRSGHIVIDIGDPNTSLAVKSRSIGLPHDIFRSPIIVRNFPTIENERRARSSDAASTGNGSIELGHHISIHRLPQESSTGSETSQAEDDCEFEGLARIHLMADRTEALTQISTAHTDFTSETGQSSDTQITSIAKIYLDLGWGQEALFIMQRLQEREPWREILARALDDLPPGNAALASALCGPASTMITLLLRPEEIDGWGIDGRALANFLTDLPEEQRRELKPRLVNALRAIGAQDDVSFLEPLDAPDPEPGQVFGTGEGTLDAIVASLEEHSPHPQDIPPKLLVNALAFRHSIPAGSERHALDQVLARALVGAGYIVEAIRLIEDGNVSADSVLSHVLEMQGSGQAIEAAMRLRDHLDLSSPAAQRTAQLLDEYGLGESADLLRPMGSDGVGTFLYDGESSSIVESTAKPESAADVATGSSEAGEADTRSQLSEVLATHRNSDPVAAATGDLARAEMAIQASRRLRETVTDFLAVPPT